MKLRNLIFFSFSFLFLACSEEQDRMIFISEESGQSQIYEMILSREKPYYRLTSSDKKEWGLTMMDENVISFFRDSDDGYVKRYSRDLITGLETELYQPEECVLGEKNIRYSPDKSLEMYECDGEIYIRYLMSRYTDNVTAKIPGESYQASWFPDSKRIAFTNKNGAFSDIFLMDIDTKEYNNITASDYNDEAPEISPDGQYLLYSANIRSLNNYDIFVLNLEDLSFENVSNTPDWEQIARWSKDGNQIAYVSNKKDGWEIYIYDRTTRKTRRMTRNDRIFDGDPYFVRY